MKSLEERYSHELRLKITLERFAKADEMLTTLRRDLNHSRNCGKYMGRSFPAIVFTS